jgi:hypothetical protein
MTVSFGAGVCKKKVWETPCAYDYFLYLPAVAAAMLAMLPSPATLGIAL